MLDKEFSSGCNNTLPFSYNNLSNTCDRHFDSCCNHVSQKLSTDLWHKRMGHIPYRRMRFLSLHGDFTAPDIPCAVCPRAKRHRLPFSLSIISASAPFALIHVDT